MRAAITQARAKAAPETIQARTTAEKASAKNDKNNQNKDPSNIKLQDELAKADAQVESC